MRFLVEVFAVLTVSLIDPVVIVPVIVSAFWKRWWLPPIIGALAGMVSQKLADAIGPGYRPDADLLVLKIIAGALLGGIVAALAPVIRKVRGNPLEGPPEKPESAVPTEWPKIKGWKKAEPDEGHGPEI